MCHQTVSRCASPASGKGRNEHRHIRLRFEAKEMCKYYEMHSIVHARVTWIWACSWVRAALVRVIDYKIANSAYHALLTFNCAYVVMSTAHNKHSGISYSVGSPGSRALGRPFHGLEAPCDFEHFDVADADPNADPAEASLSHVELRYELHCDGSRVPWAEVAALEQDRDPDLELKARGRDGERSRKRSQGRSRGEISEPNAARTINLDYDEKILQQQFASAIQGGGKATQASCKQVASTWQHRQPGATFQRQHLIMLAAGFCSFFSLGALNDPVGLAFPGFQDCPLTRPLPLLAGPPGPLGPPGRGPFCRVAELQRRSGALWRQTPWQPLRPVPLWARRWRFSWRGAWRTAWGAAPWRGSALCWAFAGCLGQRALASGVPIRSPDPCRAMSVIFAACTRGLDVLFRSVAASPVHGPFHGWLWAGCHLGGVAHAAY